MSNKVFIAKVRSFFEQTSYNVVKYFKNKVWGHECMLGSYTIRFVRDMKH